MAGLEVWATVSGGDVDLVETLLKHTRFRVRHSPGACAPCRGNTDPRQVPFAGCNSNRPGRGNGCRCTVEEVDRN